MKQKGPLPKKLEWMITEDGCWEVTSHMKNKQGYPIRNCYGKPRRIHRMSYEFFYGNIPDGLIVCHSCDNPSCINPDHLFLGTAKDNFDDMVDKGRDNLSHPRPQKLSEKEVIKIRESNLSVKTLAEKYGVSRQMIYDIQQGNLWKEVGGPIRSGHGQGWHGDSELHKEAAKVRWG